ncbi:MAG TPA: AMP-binding protein, partial [Nitrospiria bacterium]|nr:AMP-binding protein [Nitrospiria bacterium]
MGEPIDPQTNTSGDPGNPTSGILWRPDDELIRRSNVHRFMKRHAIPDAETLLSRSVGDIGWFWDAVMSDLGILWDRPYHEVYDTSDGVPWTKWFLDGKLNIVRNCLDRHADHSPDALALIWEGEEGATCAMTFGELHREICRLADALLSLGVGKGDRVGLYLPMIPEVVTAFYAILKIGAIAIPIFSGFAPSAAAARLAQAEAKLLFTADGSLRRGNVIELKKAADAVAESVPTLRHQIVVRRLGRPVAMQRGRDRWYHELIEGRSDAAPTLSVDSEDPCMILYTSGTTGKPKGAVHTHGGALAQIGKELAYHFDVKATDRFFWLTDIGWMMGPWMIIGVHLLGGSVLIFEGAPDHPRPDRLWELIATHRITHLGISPTAVRVLRRKGEEWTSRHDLSSLRILGSTGEPWDPESYIWFFESIGKSKLPIINISGGTEIVGCFLAPLPIRPLKACTLQGPGLGMDVDVFDDDGRSVRGKTGHLVCKQPAPSMTRGFWKDKERYLQTYWSRWPNVWFHGDWALVDRDGFWSLQGRSDDTMKVSGRRSGPAEIESALMAHPDVSEAAAIGVPDEITGEAIVGFAVLKPDVRPGEALRQNLMEAVVQCLGKTFRPKAIYFVSELPKTRSAKIVRRAIKAKFLGADPGD